MQEQVEQDRDGRLSGVLPACAFCHERRPERPRNLTHPSALMMRTSVWSGSAVCTFLTATRCCLTMSTQRYTRAYVPACTTPRAQGTVQIVRELRRQIRTTTHHVRTVGRLGAGTGARRTVLWWHAESSTVAWSQVNVAPDRARPDDTQACRFSFFFSVFMCSDNQRGRHRPACARTRLLGILLSGSLRVTCEAGAIVERDNQARIYRITLFTAACCLLWGWGGGAQVVRRRGRYIRLRRRCGSRASRSTRLGGRQVWAGRGGVWWCMSLITLDCQLNSGYVVDPARHAAAQRDTAARSHPVARVVTRRPRVGVCVWGGCIKEEIEETNNVRRPHGHHTLLHYGHGS